MKNTLARLAYLYRYHVTGRFHSWNLHRKIINGTAPHGRTQPK